MSHFLFTQTLDDVCTQFHMNDVFNEQWMCVTSRRGHCVRLLCSCVLCWENLHCPFQMQRKLSFMSLMELKGRSVSLWPETSVTSHDTVTLYIWMTFKQTNSKLSDPHSQNDQLHVYFWGRNLRCFWTGISYTDSYFDIYNIILYYLIL